MTFLISNPFTGLMEQGLQFLHGIFAGYPLPDYLSPYALAILSIAILIKILTFPLTQTQQRSMRGMQALQPELKKLQDQYKDDREALAAKQMELYKEHGVNPLGGCLPLIIQMLVLFGLYNAIRKLAGTPETPGPMAGERFFWIPDLAQCEPSPLCTPQNVELLIPAIPIMIIALVISQIFYQKLLTPPTTSTDPTAQAMASTMKLMPYFFAFIFASLASGLVLYYTMFNITSIIQSVLTGQHKPPEPIVANASSDSEEQSGPKGPRAKEIQRDERLTKRRRDRTKKRRG